MADPEIELPMTPAQLRLSDRAPGIRHSSTNPAVFRQGEPCPTSESSPNFDKFVEKSDGEDVTEDEEQESGDIVYHYLTFSTHLPHPTSIWPAREGQEAPPGPPDLKKYTSPFEWSRKRKDIIIWVACLITALTAFSAGSYSPGVSQMTQEWHVGSVAALVGITTFTCGMCISCRI